MTKRVGGSWQELRAELVEGMYIGYITVHQLIYALLKVAKAYLC